MKRWAIAAGVLVVVAAVVLTALLVTRGSDGGSPGPSDDGSSTSATTAPSPSAAAPSAAAPSPPVDGAIPAPAIPASAIPWDQVGAGWFLLAYDPDVADDVWDVPGHFPEIDETLMLVSPNGDLYYVRSLAGLGTAQVEAWTADGMVILDGKFDWDSGAIPYGRADAVNLATGGVTQLNTDATEARFSVMEDGRVLVRGADDGGSWSYVTSAYFAMEFALCTNYVEHGETTDVSPDGGRVVCLADGNDGTTSVVLYGLADGTATVVDTFVYSPDSYRAHGWWDANSFVLSRYSDGSDVWWAYDVTTRKIRDLDARLSDGTVADFAEGLGGYRVLTAGSVTEVQDFSGALLATLPCAPQAATGHSMLAVCGDPGGSMEVVVANLDAGTVAKVASFTTGASAELKVFPPPGGQGTSRPACCN